MIVSRDLFDFAIEVRIIRENVLTETNLMQLIDLI